MRQQQIAMLAGELLHALVGHGIAVKRLDLLLLPLARVTHQLIGGLPRLALIFAADYLQAHAKADVVFAIMGASHPSDLGDVLGDALRQIAPEQMNIGMLCGYFPGLPRTAAEVKLRKRLL